MLKNDFLLQFRPQTLYNCASVPTRPETNFHFENDSYQKCIFLSNSQRFVFVCELDDSVRYLSDRLFKCKFRTGRVLKSMGRLIVVNAKTETIIFYELEVLNQCKNIKMSKHTHPYCILLFHSKYFFRHLPYI